MRKIRIGQSGDTTRQSWLSMEKSELVMAIEASERRIRQLERNEEQVRSDMAILRHKHKDAIRGLEDELDDYDEKMSVMLTEMIQWSAERYAKNQDIVGGMAAVRGIEHVVFHFPSQAKRLTSKHMNQQRDTALAWYYLCTRLAYMPRPDSPLATLYDNAKGLEEVYGSVMWDAFTDWAG